MEIKKQSNKRLIINCCFAISFLVIFVGFIVLFFNNYYQLVPFEIEGNCNTGKLNINFDAEFKNQPYTIKEQIFGIGVSEKKNISLTKYNIEFYPKNINFEGIENLNCNYKIKGAIPKNIILENWR